MQTALTKTFNIHIKGKGQQPILFAHGLGCNQNMWRMITPSFEEEYKIILFDYIGSKDSDISKYDKEKYSTLQGYVQDVIDICTGLNLSDVIFVGHSVSCMVGVLAAIERPEIFSRMILIGPSPCYTNNGEYKGGFEKTEITMLLEAMEQNMNSWANLYAPKIMGNNDRPQLTDELKDSFCASNPEATKQFARVTFTSDNRSDLSKLKIPSLILQCSEDILAPLPVGEYVHQQIPNSSLRVLKATGHCPHLSAPEETVSVMKEYLD